MEKLTKQEEDVMMLFWQLGKACYIREVMDIYPDPKPPYTSVASTVKNLERKGYLKSTAKGVSYLYSIKISKDKYRTAFMQTWVKDYFHDSYRQMVSFFAKEQAISAEDLREILKEIEKGKM